MATYLKNHKKQVIVILAICTMLCIFLALWFSTAKYTSRITGEASVEPALFNTVLLGDLTYTKDGVTSIESNGKLTTSIVVDASMEFGAIQGESGDMTSDERRLRPGSMVAIPFTITNGTTIGGVDGEGNPVESNLAGTDIVYSLNLITTVNMPLEYDIYEYTTYDQLKYMKEKSASDEYNYEDYKLETANLEDNDDPTNWGKKLDVQKGNITSSEQVGYSRTYEIRPTTYDSSKDKEDAANLFSLKQQYEGVHEAITVNRYMLVICWPDVAYTDGKLDVVKTADLRSTKYMKEIDILEVRLEVESWVDNKTVNNPTYTEGTTSILRLSAAAVGNETYFDLPETGVANVQSVYGRVTVPFYAARPLAGSTTTSYLDIQVTNDSGRDGYVWNANTETYDPIDVVSFSGGHVAMAVPVQETMGTKNKYDDTNVFSYAIKYEGETYTGELTDSYITSETWGENSNRDSGVNTDAYVYENEHTYRIITFSRLVNGQKEYLTLPSYSSSAKQETPMQLQVTAAAPTGMTISYDNKDNFKLLVYKDSQPATPPENTPDTPDPAE